MRDPNCRLCPLGGTGRTTCIPGRSVGTAAPTARRAFIVGEAPGRQEDRHGMPFVGPSGLELAEALAEVGIADAFLTNAVRCWPDRADAKPAPSELKACAPYLDAEIVEHAPTAILALGATAWRRLGGTGSIVAQAGKEWWSEKYGCWIMPALHPAFVLRQPGRRDSWKLTLHRYAALLRGEHPDAPPVNVRVVDTEEALRELPGVLGGDYGGFTYDFETRPVPWWTRDFRPLTVAFSWSGGWSFVVPLWHPESPWVRDDIATPALRDWLREMAPVLADPTIPKGGHNGVLFDDMAWYWLTGRLPHPTFDTMVGLHLLDENAPIGLKWNGRARLGWPDWGLDRLNLESEPLADVARYNGYDTAATWHMRGIVAQGLSRDHALALYYRDVVMPGLRAVAAIQVRGIHVDETALREATAAQGAKMKAAKAALPVDNPGSTQQLARWLYEDLKLPVLKRSEKTGKPSTDEETINRLAPDHPEVKRILDYRGPLKNLGTYLRPQAARLARSYDGREHADYRIGSVETGRFSSPFHTTPREPGIRDIYSAPSPRRVLLSADYAQVEARLVAWRAAGMPPTWESVDPAYSNMLLAFRDGVDVYCVTAGEALGKRPEDVERDKQNPKNERQVFGKVVTLANLYWITPNGLRQYVWREAEVAWDQPTATRAWEGFHRAWPEIGAWHRREERDITRSGLARSPLGRWRRLPEAASGDRYVRESAIKSGINMPIQNVASDLTLTALTLFTERCAAHKGWRVGKGETFPVGFVHDSILAECDDDYDTISFVAAELEHAMLRAAPGYLEPRGLVLPPGLLKVEITVGSWGSGKDVADYLALYRPPLNDLIWTA